MLFVDSDAGRDDTVARLTTVRDAIALYNGVIVDTNCSSSFHATAATLIASTALVCVDEIYLVSPLNGVQALSVRVQTHHF